MCRMKWIVYNRSGYKLLKTHAPLGIFPCKNIIGLLKNKNIPNNKKPKIIHVTRNPKDVICSGYDYWQKMKSCVEKN